MTTPPLLAIRGLTVERLSPGEAPQPVLRDIDLDMAPAEITGVVGESGSGKTILARTLLGLLPPGFRLRARTLSLGGLDLAGLPEKGFRAIRGRDVGMIFQEPMVSLNPALTIGTQMTEAVRLHQRLGRAEARERAEAMLERVRIRDAARALDRFPHEFSGGMRQRIMLASVLMTRPKLLIADEPTTALDVVVQREVLDLLREVTAELGTAVLLITHDLGIVARYADRVTVLKRGDCLEAGTTGEVLMRPRHPYTRGLLGALPRRAVLPAPKAGPPLLSVEGLRVGYGRPLPWRRAAAPMVLRDVSFSLRRGETLAVVGESGSGKTTLGRSLVRLVDPAGGEVRFDGVDLRRVAGGALRAVRPRLQMVFQDPASSLDPRFTVGGLVGEGLTLRRDVTALERAARVAAALEEVGLPADWAERRPHQLSGGQRQRVSIARALVLDPDLLVLDEPVSALDMTVQAQVLDLLAGLQERRGLSYLFITHDLRVVDRLAHRILVLYRGAVVESGPRDAVLDRPAHPYTRQLLSASPELAQDAGGVYRIAERTLPPPLLGEEEAYWPHSGGVPAYRTAGPDHLVACRHPSPAAPPAPAPTREGIPA